MNRLKVFLNYMINIIKSNLGAIIGLILVTIMLTVRLPYNVYAPGGAINIEDRLSNRLYKSKGSLNLTYVSSLEGNIPAILVGLVNPNWDVVKSEDILVMDEDMEEMTLRETVSLYESISAATYVGYDRAGIETNITSTNYYVYYIYKDEADTDLKAGDKIISFDNIEFKDSEDLHKYIDKKSVGTKINFKVLRKGIETDAYGIIQDVGEGNKALCILIDTIFNFENDPDIHYSYQPSEIGSSGGLMLTLSIYNALTKKDITKGLKISGTGTISLNGDVGPIGGVKYKIMGAVANDCDVFIVPKENYKEAKNFIKKKKYDIKLIKADNVDQVIDELNSMEV